MTKTNVQSTPSNSQHHDTPNNKTHIIKFRVTAEEKTSLELTCKLLNLSLSTFIRRAIKSHQYIISFDPRDSADNGLTMEKAQALGLKFCSENFPGHPAIVCTHPDGHNRSGNIHVHIVIGSIRTREVERKPYMQKPCDWREGMKHSSIAQTMRHLRVEVMELCEGAGLYQIDLLNGSKERVSEVEYRQQQNLRPNRRRKRSEQGHRYPRLEVYERRGDCGRTDTGLKAEHPVRTDESVQS